MHDWGVWMAKSGTWLTVGSTAIALGLANDNFRLREQLEAHQPATTAAATTETAVTKQSPVSKRTRTLPKPSTHRQTTGPRGSLSQEEIESQIEQQVAQRLEQAVEKRIDEDLDSLVEERVDRRMDERHDQRRQRLQAMMEEHIAEYAAEHEISDETEAGLVTILEDASSSIGDLFRSVHSGDIEREDAHEEVQQVREELAASLEELLGQEEAELFQEDLRGPLGRRWAGRR